MDFQVNKSKENCERNGLMAVRLWLRCSELH